MNLKKLEQNIYKTNFQDGIYDICFGIMFIGMGLSSILKNSGLIKPLNYLLFPIIAVLFLYLGKKYITTPRIGIVNYSKIKKAAKRKINLSAAIIIIINISFIIGLTSLAIQIKQGHFQDYINFPEYFPILMLSIPSIIIIASIASFLNYFRLLLYGFFWLISFLSAELLYLKIGSPLDGIIPFTISGTICLIIGTILLIKFVKNNQPENVEYKTDIIPEVEIKSNSYLTFMEDGILEMGLGFLLLLAGLFLITNQISILWITIFPAISIVLLKRKITYPRNETINLKTNQEKQITKISITILLSIVTIFSILLYILKPQFLSLQSLIFILGETISLYILIDVSMLNTKKSNINVFITAFIILSLLGFVYIKFHFIFLILGCAAIIDGNIILIKFLQNNPIENNEVE